MPSCAAVGCQNITEDPNPTISWKYLPTRNKRQRELWLTGGLPQERNTALCSSHFDSECFEGNLKKEFETKSETEIYKIKDDAIPTIFTYKKDKTSITVNVTCTTTRKKKIYQ